MVLEQSLLKPEISSEEAKEILTGLEDIVGLPDQSIFFITLVYLGLKNSAEVALPFYEWYKGYDQQAYQEDVEHLAQAITQLGLVFEKHVSASTEEDLQEGYAPIYTTFYFGKSRATAEKLKEAFLSHSNSVGELLGFPQSAVEAFPSNSLEGWPPKELEGREELKFLYFVPSKNSWEQEMKFLMDNVRAVERLIPDLYKRMKNKSSE